MSALLEGRSLAREFAVRSSGRLRLVRFRALDGVSLELAAGETLGVVGESGSGKSTLARLLAGVDEPSSGEVRFDGEVLPKSTRMATPLRRAIQMVFQDPHSALNPRRTVGQALLAPRRALFGESERHGSERRARALAQVGLSEDFLGRYPHELSGGQAQRIGIARALLAEPRVVILDEALASLDLATQDDILELLTRLKAELGLAYLFISHDLLLVAAFCDRALVLHRGRKVEEGAARAVLESPEQPYTRALAAAVPHLPGTESRPSRNRP